MGFSYNYYWSQTGSHGKPGEIPKLLIRKDDAVPPLDALHSVKVCSIYDKIEESDLFLFWKVEGSGVGLRLYCKANDERLRAEYKAHPDISDKIIDLLIKTEEQHPREYPTIILNQELPQELPKDRLSPELLEGVELIEGWQEFCAEYRTHLSRYGGRVDDEGYYLAGIMGSAIVLPGEEWTYCEKGFQFDPKENPPAIFESEAVWTMPDIKVKVVLTYEFTGDDVASYYGFLKEIQTFREKKAAEKKEDDDRFKEYLQKSRDEEAKKRQELHEALLP